MSFRSLEAHLSCHACGERVNVNALALRAACRACGEEHDLHGAWRGVELDEGEREYAHLTVAVGAPEPSARCPACRAELSIDGAKEAALTTGRASVTCVCGEAVLVRRRPKEVRWPHEATLLIGEDESLLSPAEPCSEGDPKPAETVVLSCSKCGASLSTDGSRRNVDCRYCSTTNVLGDDVWRKLHPISKLRPFFVHLDPAIAAADYESQRRARKAEGKRRHEAAEIEPEAPQARTGRKLTIVLVVFGVASLGFAALMLTPDRAGKRDWVTFAEAFFVGITALAAAGRKR